MADQGTPGPCFPTETLSKQIETGKNNFIGDLEIKDLQQTSRNSIKKKPHLKRQKSL